MAGIRSIIYATGNEIKFQVAARVMADSGIVLQQNRIELPEIQSMQVEEVARFSAVWASHHLDQPVAVTDAGFYITALNGFPGPFVRYTNEWLSSEDYLNLMRGKADRSVIIRESLAFCQPGSEPVIIVVEYLGKLANKIGRKSGTVMDQIFVPDGYSVPISEIPGNELMPYWNRGSAWQKLRKYLVEAE